MKFEIKSLPYGLGDLEPVISKKTMEYHYGKHLQGYVDKLNELIPGTKYENLSLEEIVKQADGKIFNNAAQVWNHDFYFEQFSKKREEMPKVNLLDLVNKTFGSFTDFKTKFNTASTDLFGSGWAFLVYDKSDRKLYINSYEDAKNPLESSVLVPLLTFDVWEHAYYLDYYNKRVDYVKKLWDIIDWSVIQKRFDVI